LTVDMIWSEILEKAGIIR